ncbi:MAG: FAD binding domain-containing protein [Proteobacteria bacterium]|nr:FAD binding domain-containing protein [Pseudomonadota bacterium]
MLYCDAYLTPRSLADAFTAMAEYRGRYRLVAGATDTLPWARAGRAGDVAIPALIDVSAIPELRERRVDATRVRIGAATPMQRFLDDGDLARAMPVMARCAVWFADDQIRAAATVGGNLVNASPAADATPPLLAHDAQVELACAREGKITRRRMALGDFVRGPGKTALEADEILLAIECAALPGYGAEFEKVGHRRSLVIATVCLAAVVRLDAAHAIADLRLAVGGVGPVPCRLHESENFLRGGAATLARLEEAAHMTVGLVQSRTRHDYRRDVLHGFVVRGLASALRRAGGASPPVGELEASHA